MYTSLKTKTEYKINEGNKAIIHATLFAVLMSQSLLASFQPKKTQPIPKNKLMDCAINTLLPNKE